MGAVFVPYRGIYFLYEYLDGYITEEELVFVPYRGIYFLYQQKKIFENIIEECFRPLSGNLLSLRYYYSDAKVKDVDGFSSPIGESTFSTNSYIFSPTLISFSSPIGESTFSTQYKSDKKSYYFLQFSSPIGESTFSTCIRVSERLRYLRVFVPYRGIYFLYCDARE